MSAPRPTRLNNSTCPYCASKLLEGQWNEEHVVARRLVPKGCLEQQWNLIPRACITCNRRKGQLEDELGSLSMQPDVFGRHSRPEPALVREAHRKAIGSYSRETHRPVSDSAESHRIEGTVIPGVKASFVLKSPPRINENRAFELAGMQIAALFYWITFDEARDRGGVWPGVFCPVAVSLRTDWGRPLLRAFMTVVGTWQPRVVLGTASGFFKVAIRRHPEAVCWSWAVEWNENARVVGFFGDASTIEGTADQLAANGGREVVHRTGDFGFRLEVPLSPEDDHLFAVQEEPAGKA